MILYALMIHKMTCQLWVTLHIVMVENENQMLKLWPAVGGKGIWK